VPLALLGLLYYPLIPILAVLLCVIGVPAASGAERDLKQHDSGIIVIDEAAGFLISVCFLPLTPFYLVGAFILFRFFDIVNPPPARQMERLSGGWGVIMDDVVAGIYANLVLQLVRLVVA
jgi:phosphatidylglycerophosphatase A